jgi:hypothetical protein
MMSIPDEWWRWKPRPAQAIFAAAYAALNLAYVALGCAGFFLWGRRHWLSPGSSNSGTNRFRQLALAMAASLILRCALLLTLDNAEPRYTLEFFPVLLAWAGALFA